MKRTAQANSLTDRLAALAEPLRLRILRLLESQELSVGEVAKIVQLPQSTVSRHLKILSEGQWIARRAVGTATHYRLLLDDLTPQSRALWLAVREQMDASPDLAEDARRLDAVIAERRLDSQAFFGRVAGEWDSLRGQLFGNEFTAPALLSLLPDHWTVADLGCGTGNASELLAPCVKQVVAIDQSEPMLDAAKKRLAGAKNVQFRSGSLEQLPLDEDSVDAAVCILVLHHIDNPPAAVAEMARILRPGGIALIVDMFEHDRPEYRQTMGHRHTGFSSDQTTQMFKQAGFNTPRIQALPSDPEGKGPGLFAATASFGNDPTNA